jgi:hypothetical protein
MEVLNTTSATACPAAPIDVPRNTVPSAKISKAGRFCDTATPSVFDFLDQVLIFNQQHLSNFIVHHEQMADMQNGRSVEYSSRFRINEL